MPQFDDDLWLGPVLGRQTQGAAGSAPPSRGFGPLGRIYVYDIVPATLSATAVCAAQAISGTNVSALINGASASGGVATLDVARCPNIVSSNAGDTTQTVTLTGTDINGYTITAVKTLNGTSTVIFDKAFKTVTSVVVSATMAGNLSVGSSDRFGLPVVVSNVAYIASVKWNSTLASDAGTFVAADATSPATASTTDARGMYTPSANASNGVRRLVIGIMLTGLQVGPNATFAALNGAL